MFRFCWSLSEVFPRNNAFMSRCVSCGKRLHDSNKKSATGKNSSSTRWLRRHLTDPYVKKALGEDYRCRSAYKLIELDDKFQFLRPGRFVVDCGASPGSWSQVAVERVASQKHRAGGGRQPGHVLAVDLLEIKDIPGATILQRCDFTSEDTQEKLLSLLPVTGADILMSDMAPNASGNHRMDHDRILDLSTSAFDFSTRILRSGGIFLCKLWDGYRTRGFINRLEAHFRKVQKCKPQASRKESAEIYIYAQDFKRSLSDRL